MKIRLAMVAAVTAFGLGACTDEADVAEAACDTGAASASASGCAQAWVDANVRANQTQAIGTHNSFKIWLFPEELQLIADVNPEGAKSLEYGHPPIAEQLEAGARQLELDPYYDPDGGRFVDPMGPRMLAARGIEVPEFDASELEAPGIKVFHTPDIDYRSQCLTFVACLQQVKAWSDANRDHSPILLMINTKSSSISWDGATEVLVWDKAAFDLMDEEILSVLPRERIITPDDVRGSHATLREGVTGGGWPTMAEARGRVIFGIDNGPETTALYAEGHPSLEGRLAFINTHADAPEAGYFTMNDPVQDQALIAERVAQGFLVRTRADANTQEGRTGDTTRLEAALASGAQFISTDYMTPNESFGTGYTAALPGGETARCNPVSAPEGCDAAVE